jgi:pimeloyl-ACP methyl ester carboxylesterase
MRALTIPRWKAVLRYHDAPGPGRPLVMLHGLGCASSCDYPRVVLDPALARRRFILIDFFGSGFSDHPADFPYTVEAHAETVVCLADTLGLESFDVFGHSMGGSVAIVVAGLLRDRVARLVAGEPNLDAGGGEFSRGIAGGGEVAYVAEGHARLMRDAAARGNIIWTGSMARSYPPAVHRAASSLVRGGTTSWRDLLYGLPMKRTIVFGEASLPDPDTEALPAHGVNVEIVPRAGHSMAWDNPEGLARALDRALA